MKDEEKPRCAACPFGAMAEAFAEVLAEKLCKRERPQAQPRFVPIEEAVRRLGPGWSRRTLDRNRKRLPFIRERESGRGYDIIGAAFDEFLRTR